MTHGNIDLNADMGEYQNEAMRKTEAQLMPLISSCSIACGGHAGDQETMRHTALLAKASGVSVGAHPAYPDREGFGRRSLSYNADDLRDSLTAQIDTLKNILDKEHMTLHHIKPHGALYNDAAKDHELAQIVADISKGYILMGPPQSALEMAAQESETTFAPEGFIDRLYQASGALTPRSVPGAIISETNQRAAQAICLARGDTIQAADGSIQLLVKTLCIHSDSPGAVETARHVRQALEQDGFTIRTFS